MKPFPIIIIVMATIFSVNTLKPPERKSHKRGLVGEGNGGFNYANNGVDGSNAAGNNGATVGVITQTVNVPVPQPYEVPVVREVPIPIPRPRKVYVPRPIYIPVPRPQPYIVPRPVRVEIQRPIPVPVPHPVRVPVHVPVRVSVPQAYPVAVPQRVPVIQPETLVVPYPVSGNEQGFGNNYGGIENGIGGGSIPLESIEGKH